MITKTMNRFLLMVLFLTAQAHFCFSYNTLSVLDPKSRWRTGKGSIDNVTISVNPKGIYTEISYYATMSAKASDYTSSSDTLEIVWDFTLPEDALIIDSWLWVGQDIVQAKIMDKWTARGIYEGIVQRNQDPSILTKINKNDYQLRIFPLPGNSSRKIMLKIMVKNTWSTDGRLSCVLPLSILRGADNVCCSYNYNTGQSRTHTGIPNNAQILLKNLDDFPITSASSTSSEFTINDYEDEINGKLKGVTLESTFFAEGLKLTYTPKALKDGIYLNTYATSPSEGYYQLVLLPQKILQVPAKRKTVFLVDYDQSKSDLTKEQIYRYLKSTLLDSYTATDSFAIFFSGLNIVGTGSNWIAGDENSKANVFNSLKASNINTYSNLLSVINKGTSLVNKDKSGDIILISASSSGYSSSAYNPLLNDIVAGLPEKTRFSIIDVSKYNSYSYVNNIGYYNDAYFYSSLARFTKGIYYAFSEAYFQHSTEADYQKFLEKTVNFNSGTLSAYDISTSLENGFCTGKFTFNNNSNTFNLQEPYLQVGKYYGTLPFSIQFSGIYDNIPFSRKININAQELATTDNATKTIWHGKYILEQENITPTNNNIISDIIDNSLNNRVLSLYTAFLALEPRLGGEICQTCVDESETVTDIESIIYPNRKDSLDIITVFPLPVRDQCTIVLKAQDQLNGSLKVYNMAGTVVNEIELAGYTRVNNEIHISYDWSDETVYPNGIYMLVYSNGQKMKKGKVVLQR